MKLISTPIILARIGPNHLRSCVILLILPQALSLDSASITSSMWSTIQVRLLMMLI